MPSSSSSSSSSDDGSTLKASTETTPLLAAASSAPVGEAAAAAAGPASNQEDGPEGVFEDDDTPIPVAQIALLCYARLIEPIAFFSIFPYINAMIERTGGVAKEDVGFYSGLIESLFSATQMCVMLFWGKAADRFGRKPVLVISLFGMTFCVALFGMSHSLWQMILFRCLAGIFAGTVVTIRAMLAENSTKKTQARVFSWFAFVNNLGIFAGPLVGGALESPADKFPSTFGRVRFFREYPYAFPGFVVSLFGLSAFLLVTFSVKETLHLHRDKKKSDTTTMSTWELIKYPGVLSVIVIYNYILLLAFAFTAAYPVFLYEPISVGGLEFSPKYIAGAMAFGGGAQALWLLLAFPPLHRRIGTGGVMWLCAFVWPIFFGISPLCNVMRKHKLEVPFWILFIIDNGVGSGVAMAFTAGQLAINDIAPSHETFGMLNALVLALMSGLRAIVPGVSTSIYAVGVKYQIFGGELFWVLLVIVAVGLSFVLRFLPEKIARKPQRAENGHA